jgi:hypothetical protein
MREVIRKERGSARTAESKSGVDAIPGQKAPAVAVRPALRRSQARRGHGARDTDDLHVSQPPEYNGSGHGVRIPVGGHSTMSDADARE